MADSNYYVHSTLAGFYSHGNVYSGSKAPKYTNDLLEKHQNIISKWESKDSQAILKFLGAYYSAVMNYTELPDNDKQKITMEVVQKALQESGSNLANKISNESLITSVNENGIVQMKSAKEKEFTSTISGTTDMSTVIDNLTRAYEKVYDAKQVYTTEQAKAFQIKHNIAIEDYIKQLRDVINGLLVIYKTEKKESVTKRMQTSIEKMTAQEIIQKLHDIQGVLEKGQTQYQTVAQIQSAKNNDKFNSLFRDGSNNFLSFIQTTYTKLIGVVDESLPISTIQGSFMEYAPGIMFDMLSDKATGIYNDLKKSIQQVVNQSNINKNFEMERPKVLGAKKDNIITKNKQFFNPITKKSINYSISSDSQNEYKATYKTDVLFSWSGPGLTNNIKKAKISAKNYTFDHPARSIHIVSGTPLTALMQAWDDDFMFTVFNIYAEHDDALQTMLLAKNKNLKKFKFSAPHHEIHQELILTFLYQGLTGDYGGEMDNDAQAELFAVRNATTGELKIYNIGKIIESFIDKFQKARDNYDFTTDGVTVYDTYGDGKRYSMTDNTTGRQNLYNTWLKNSYVGDRVMPNEATAMERYNTFLQDLHNHKIDASLRVSREQLQANNETWE